MKKIFFIEKKTHFTFETIENTLIFCLNIVQTRNNAAEFDFIGNIFPHFFKDF